MDSSWYFDWWKRERALEMSELIEVFIVIFVENKIDKNTLENPWLWANDILANKPLKNLQTRKLLSY